MRTRISSAICISQADARSAVVHLLAEGSCLLCAANKLAFLHYIVKHCVLAILATPVVIIPESALVSLVC